MQRPASIAGVDKHQVPVSSDVSAELVMLAALRAVEAFRNGTVIRREVGGHECTIEFDNPLLAVLGGRFSNWDGQHL